MLDCQKNTNLSLAHNLGAGQSDIEIFKISDILFFPLSKQIIHSF